MAAAVTDAAAEALGTRWSYVGLIERETARLRLVPVEGRPGDDDTALLAVRFHPAEGPPPHAS